MVNIPFWPVVVAHFQVNLFIASLWQTNTLCWKTLLASEIIDLGFQAVIYLKYIIPLTIDVSPF